MRTPLLLTHTPGPWGVETKGSKHFVDGSDGLTVCVVDRQGVRCNRAENEANAVLIAAAPELLAACKTLLADPYLSDSINSDRMAACRIAVAKAEGIYGK